MNRTIQFLFILGLLFGCGLKITENVDDNVLLGTWKLDRISCASSFTSTTELEKYDLSSVATVTLIFSGNKINYTSSGLCSTSSTGLYSTNFNGSSTGVVDFQDIVTGGVTCTETIADSGTATVGNATVPTTLLGTYSTNLSWKVSNERDILELEYYADFPGSGTSTACNSGCVCKAIFLK